MYPLISILSWLIIGGICSNVARNRGRNPIAWFVLGMALGVIGLITLYILPIKGDIPEVKMAPLSPQPPPNMAKKLWYYLDSNRKQQGPMSFERMKQAWKDRDVNENSLVWNENLSEWKKVEDLGEIHSFFKTLFN